MPTYTTVRRHMRRLRARRTVHGLMGQAELEALSAAVRAAIHHAGGIANLGHVIEAIRTGIRDAQADEQSYSESESARLAI